MQPFQFVRRENKVHEVLNKNPVTKIRSTEFAVFGQALPEYSFRENFCPQGDRTLQLDELLYSYIQGFLSKTTNNHLYVYEHNR